MPFEGQGVQSAKTAAKVTPKPNNGPAASKTTSSFNAEPRKQVSQPSGKLVTNNIGIKETLNPAQQKRSDAVRDIISDLADDFTIEQLEHVWKEYALGVKRKRKDSLYSTLVKSKMTMSSDYQIHLDIVNALQGKELEAEKGELLGFIRSKLRNYTIGLKYSITESKKMEILDSKGVFDKLAEDNSSLNKFRKLFNLDIEF